MKTRIIAFFLSIICSVVMAQEEPNTIQLTVNVVHKDSSPLYKALVSFGLGYSSVSSKPEEMTIENLKEGYKQELETAGFPFKVLKENPYGFGYETLGHKNEGIIYEYTTTSMADMKKFIKIRPLGVERVYVTSIIEIDAKETLELAKMAIANAKEKASAMAEAMGKKLGKIIKVYDLTNRRGNNIEALVHYDFPADHCVYSFNITFKVED